jgi:hypothetical protein
MNVTFAEIGVKVVKMRGILLELPVIVRYVRNVKEQSVSEK